MSDGWAFSFQFADLLAMVLAIGLVVDDAIVVWRTSIGILEEANRRCRPHCKRARDRGSRDLDDYYAFGGMRRSLPRRTAGSLFREFAFTLAGSVIVSGVDRAEAVAERDGSVFRQERREACCGEDRETKGSRRDAPVWPQARSFCSLIVRVTGLFALTILGLCRLPLYGTTLTRSGRSEEDMQAYK